MVTQQYYRTQQEGMFMNWEIFCKGNPEGLQEDGDTPAVFEGNPQKTSLNVRAYQAEGGAQAKHESWDSRNLWGNKFSIDRAADGAGDGVSL